MKKLYNHTKGKIHPSPPPSSSTTSDHHLSLLPLAIATLAAALPPQDLQVLAYLLSISTTITNVTGGAGKPTNNSDDDGNHPPQFNCSCFRCYTSFWVRWDASPNRKVIHEIIDAYEDGLIRNKKNGKNKKERKNNKRSSSTALHSPPAAKEILTREPVPETAQNMIGDDESAMGSSEKGSVRKIVNFIGERIWGVWGV